MARTNMNATRRKPEVAQIAIAHVLRTERISPSFARVTLGGEDLARFSPMGFDQWFRLFLPVGEASVASLARMPAKLDTLSYLRYLAIAKTERPVLRNYTVRAFRASGPDGPELDVDFVLHGSAADGTAGPAATWAETVRPGSPVALLDEGIAFAATPAQLSSLLLVADETGLPAVMGIVESLPRDAVGTAIVEIPCVDDAQAVDAPEGIDLRWVVRADPHAVPGRAAAHEAIEHSVASPSYGWVAGEQSLATSLRRHWVQAGTPKSDISFVGYWRHSARH